MKVLFINDSDYANFSFMLSQSLRSVGVDSHSVTFRPHKFGYSAQSTRVSDRGMDEEIELADIVVIGHSFAPFLEKCKSRGKRYFVVHTGTRYRQDADTLNDLFNPVVERTLTDSPEFMELGAKMVTYIATAVDTGTISPITSPTTSNRICFAHYPSNAKVKGTGEIINLMRHTNLQFKHSTTRLPHRENLQRMGKCDVYIEMFSPEQKGKVYGSAGVTAWEAAALGKVVVTNFLFPEVYRNVYGQMPFYAANTPEDFLKLVRTVGGMDIQTVRSLGTHARMLIEENHSLKSTGRYLLKLLR